MRITIMQPYLIPYAGYFRLLSQSDLFVLYDDVQFIKGGWIHRNMLTRRDGKKDWLTLPLKRKSLDTKINEMEWGKNALARWSKQLNKFPVFNNINTPLLGSLFTAPQWISPLRLIEKTIDFTKDELGIQCPIVFSSNLEIPYNLKGQERVLHVCETVGATEYLNASGGKHLYERREFKKRNIELKFLSEYPNKASILERLQFESGGEIREDLDRYGIENA